MVPYETNGMMVMDLVQERQQQEEELKVKEAELIGGNPLLNNPTSVSVKRRLVASTSLSLCGSDLGHCSNYIHLWAATTGGMMTWFLRTRLGSW